MNLLRRKPKHLIPSREKRELALVKRRLDRLEPRVESIELELKLFRREL